MINSTWNHLEDLQQWLTIREVSYTFTSRHPQYGGAKYYGKWSVAMPHIKLVCVLLQQLIFFLFIIEANCDGLMANIMMVTFYMD